MEPFQETSGPESTCDPSDISHLNAHTSTTKLCAVSVTSNLADSDLQSALVKFQRGITELKDIVVNKFSDDKPDNPRLGYCDFLKVEVVQLTSDSYKEFQQETFNLVNKSEIMNEQYTENEKIVCLNKIHILQEVILQMSVSFWDKLYQREMCL